MSNKLEDAIFNDRAAAKVQLERMAASLNERTPSDQRLSYLNAASFLDNQYYHFEAALVHLDQAKAIIPRRAHAQIFELHLDRAAILLNLRRLPEVQKALDEARSHLKYVSGPRLRAHLTAREGLLHLRLDNQVQALELLLEAEKNLMALGGNGELKDYYILTLVISGLGALYERLNEREKSIEAYRRVLPIVEEHHLWPRLPWHYLNTGRMLFAQSSLDEAKDFFEKSLQTAGEGDVEVRAIALSNLGIIALLSKDTVQAAARFDAGAALFKEPTKPEDYDNLAKTELWRSALARELGNSEDEETHLLNAFQIGQNGLDLYNIRRIAINLSDFYARFDQYERGLEWQRQATALTESHFMNLRENERRELDARYQIERIRQEAQMAKLRVAGLQSRALRAQMNPHFLFNALNAIQGFITSGRDTEAATYLARFAKFMRQTLEYSDLEVVELEDEIKFIEKYLEINRNLRFREQLHYKVFPPLGTDAGDLLIPAMIVQPFVENAIEHGLRPKQQGTLHITFQLTENGKNLLCIIEDDGVGFNKGRQKQASHSAEHQTHRSRGMDITRERLSLLHGDTTTSYVTISDLSDLTNGERNGTRVEVLLPLLEETA